jgi:hypothetical protein
MKEDFDREIDSLLRRRARWPAESRPWDDGAQGAHLDADELGAFAEGALPAAARLAAASHLADCASCRGIVISLAPAASSGAAGAEVKPHALPAIAPVETARPSAWRAFVASLFAPRVMRFAVPVLALSLVGVVSYVALRSKSGGALEMARDARPNKTGVLKEEPSAPAASNTGTADSNIDLLTTQNNNAAPREQPPVAGAPPASDKGHGGAEGPAAAEHVADVAEAQPSTAAPSTAAPPPPPPAASAPAEGPPDLSKAAPKPVTTEEGEVARVENRDRADNKEKSARSSEPADDAVANEAAVQQRRAAQSRMNQVQMPDGGDSRNQKRAADNNTSGNYGGGNAGTSAPAKDSDRERAGTRSEAVGRARAARPAEKKADQDEPARAGDTRAAAGHRFRREGSAWVDVNYKSSMRSTGVRRGTEGFRALVADVPEVGRVAEAIGGEVIVVVGGRAYRIR